MIVALIGQNAYPTDERLAVLEQYPCSSLLVSFYVNEAGESYLASFSPVASHAAGLPCISKRTADTLLNR